LLFVVPRYARRERPPEAGGATNSSIGHLSLRPPFSLRISEGSSA